MAELIPNNRQKSDIRLPNNGDRYNPDIPLAELEAHAARIVALAEKVNIKNGGSPLEIGEIIEKRDNVGLYHAVEVFGDLRTPLQPPSELTETQTQEASQAPSSELSSTKDESNPYNSPESINPPEIPFSSTETFRRGGGIAAFSGFTIAIASTFLTTRAPEVIYMGTSLGFVGLTMYVSALLYQKWHLQREQDN